MKTIIKRSSVSYKKVDGKNLAIIADIAELEAYNHPSSSWSMTTFNETFKRSDLLAYAAFINDCVIAYIVMVVVMDEAEILNICVHNDYRRQGQAERLITQCEKDLLGKNVSKLLLEMRKCNTVAKALYHKLGFTQYNHRKNYYQDGEDALLFIKKI